MEVVISSLQSNGAKMKREGKIPEMGLPPLTLPQVRLYYQ